MILFFKNFRDTAMDILSGTDYGKNLMKRTMILEVGLSGNVSVLDEDIVHRQKLKPLNKFEKWLVAPYVEELKVIHKDAWKHAIKDVLGEEI